MLSELLHEINNFFDRDTPHFHGAFTIEDGKITDADVQATLQANQYFRIIGSVFNDGVYKNDDKLELTDEIFVGSVVLMAIPRDVLNLSSDIDAWITKYGETSNSPYNSESFGGYSYSKSSGNSKSANPTWQSVFKNRLDRWRKI